MEERLKSQQQHTKPMEPEVRPSADAAPAPAKKQSASIFGAAKPVDTAAKEREIEERLKKLQLEESKRLDDRP